VARIVHLANFYGPRSGGLRTTVRALAAGYAVAGHDTHIVVPGETNATTREAGATVHQLAGLRLPGSGGYRVIVGRRRVSELLESLRPDRIELSDRTTLLHVADWARNNDVPTVMFAHERVDGVISAFAPRLPAVRIADRLNVNAFDRVDHIVCTTSFAQQEFRRIGINTTLVPLGVDLNTFSPENRSATWRSAFQAPFIALMCSRLSKEKCPDFALDVADEISRRRLPMRIVIAGDGPMADELARRALAARVPMLGYVSGRHNVATMLASADALIAPGPIETFGLAALESLASGTPVLAHHRSAVPEIVGDAGRALPLDARRWVDALQEMSHDSRSLWSHRARVRAEQFDWASTVRKMLDLHGLADAVPARSAA